MRGHRMVRLRRLTALAGGVLMATAVQEFPADAVDYALDALDVDPDVVVSGINFGQNRGPVVDVSGTVGAERQAARRNVPALAVSAQLGDAPDYRTAARLALQRLDEHRRALARRARAKAPAPPTTIDNLNVPNCPGGRIRGVLRTVGAPPGTPDAITTTSNCASTATASPHDVAAFNDGWATLTRVPTG